MTELAAGTPEPVIKLEDHGPAVGNLIDVLTFWQWLPAAEPDAARVWEFTAEVEDGVRAAQAALDVSSTGKWDKATALAYSALLSAGLVADNAWPPAMAPGDTGADVEALQTALTHHGLYSGPVHGEYDVLTSVAVQQVQRRAKDVGQATGPIDGLWTEATRQTAQRFLGDPPA